MPRATGALMAMLTLGALACTFDHTGLQPGPATVDGGSDADPSDDAAGDDGASTSDASDEDPRADDGATNDAKVEGSTRDAPGDSPTRPDGNVPTDASPSIDGDVPDGDLEASGSERNARFDCASVPNGVTFTTPGSANAHCYWLHATAMNWLAAANACAAERGHLVTLGSSAEATFLLGLVPVFVSSDRVWIGGTDARFSSDGPGSGPFVWITGEPMTYQDWASNGQP